MNSISVKIRGMGGIINFEALLIERLFKELGYQVEVDNNCPYEEKNPHPSAINETEDEFVERCKKLNHSKTTVKLEVEHCPWGG
jgi:hypothetical protein